MANSVELRVPLLDHRVMEFAASLPSHFKVRGGETKRILKAAFAKTLPAEVLHRKKAGFPVPYAKWLSHGLHTRVSDIVMSDRSLSRGYFKKGEIQRLLDALGKGRAHSKEIFSLLVLELWHQRFLDGRPSSPLYACHP
jgi:asparagine synthase (glutamine-hydrolysing)